MELEVMRLMYESDGAERVCSIVVHVLYDCTVDVKVYTQVLLVVDCFSSENTFS